VPGTSFFHRLGTGPKYLVMLALTLPAFLAGRLWLSVALLALCLGLLATCRVGLRYAWGLPRGLWLLVALLFGYHLLSGNWPLGVLTCTNLLVAVYASRLVTLTTPGAELVDALVRALRPLRVLGVNPDRVGLAIAVMLRSVPVILDSFGEVRQAAQARGRERNLFALVAPVVVRAVGHAQAMGAALAARGLGDESAGSREALAHDG
jgi:biotin transport system permease protein